MNKYTRALTLPLLIAASCAHADITANVSLTNDYRARGISQTGENPALQGGLDYYNEAGFFAGVWGSNVDFYKAGDAWDNNESLEIDTYVGYYHPLNDTVSADISLYRYFYPGATINSDYSELQLGVTVGALRLGYAYADDYINVGKNYQYINADYKFSLPSDFGLKLHAGYSFGSYFDNPAAAWLDKYTDYSLTLSHSWGGVDFSLAYMNTNVGSPYAIKNDYLANQGAWVFTIGKNF